MGVGMCLVGCEQNAIQDYITGGQTSFMRKKICKDNGITTGMLGQWLQDQDKIRHAYTHKKTAALRCGAIRPARFPAAEKELQSRFKDRRLRGCRVTGRWLVSTMLQLVKEMYPGSKFVASAGWLHRCSHRLGIGSRTKSNCKGIAAQDRLPAVLKWLASYRLMLNSPPNKTTSMHTTWGRFPPHLRFNCDQVVIA